VTEHCAQCLTKVYASGHETPSGNTLCRGCYTALWGPNATDDLREAVARHSDSRNGFRPRPVIELPR
jgi:hypothetical protein